MFGLRRLLAGSLDRTVFSQLRLDRRQFPLGLIDRQVRQLQAIQGGGSAHGRIIDAMARVGQAGTAQ
jgi:hypothetical protein